MAVWWLEARCDAVDCEMNNAVHPAEVRTAPSGNADMSWKTPRDQVACLYLIADTCKMADGIQIRRLRVITRVRMFTTHRTHRADATAASNQEPGLGKPRMYSRHVDHNGNGAMRLEADDH